MIRLLAEVIQTSAKFDIISIVSIAYYSHFIIIPNIVNHHFFVNKYINIFAFINKKIQNLLSTHKCKSDMDSEIAQVPPYFEEKSQYYLKIEKTMQINNINFI